MNDKRKSLHPDAILNFVLDNFKYTFNPLANDYEFEGKRVDADMVTHILNLVQDGLSSKITRRQLRKAIFEKHGQGAKENKEGEMPYKPIPIEDPVTEYIKTLEDTPRDTGIINRFADSFPIKDSRAKPLLKKWILSFSSTYMEGKAPGMLVLGGGDCGFREHVLDNLIPPGLKKYHIRERLGRGVDTKKMLCRNVLVGTYEILNWTPLRIEATRDLILRKEYTWKGRDNRGAKQRHAMLACSVKDTSPLQGEGNQCFLCIDLKEHGSEAMKRFYESFDAIDKTTLFNEAWIQGRRVWLGLDGPGA